MQIAHIGNTAGVASKIAKEQRKKGHNVDVFVFDDFTEKRFGGVRVNYNSKIAKFLFHRKLKSYDIWHYHYPYGSLKEKLEKMHQDQIFLKHYHGSDLRGKYDEDFCLVSTPDLLKYAPNAAWLPIPIDLKEIECYRNNTTCNVNSPPLIAHYPSYGNMRSYNFVYSNVFNRIENENKGKIINILNLSHEEALKKISYSNISIGKILPEMGWFATFELESMALGKPVMAYVSDELYDLYAPPIFRTTIDTFEDDLITLLSDESEMRRLSIEGLKYVEKHHNSQNITERLYKYYSSEKVMKN